MKRPQRTPILLDYSSMAEERRRDAQIEKERRQAIKNYNLSTFGEREPSIVSIVCFLLFAIAVTRVLPKWQSNEVIGCGVLIYLAVRAFLERR